MVLDHRTAPTRAAARAAGPAVGLACCLLVVAAACRPGVTGPAGHGAAQAPTVAAADDAGSGGVGVAYPPRRITAEPPLVADASGYFPLPPNVPAQLEALDASRHAVGLSGLQRELDLHDAAALAARIADADGGIVVGRIGVVEPGLYLDRSVVERILQALFRNGSRPKVQGYKVAGASGGVGPCLDIVIADWLGRVRLPTKEPESHGEPVPSELPIGASVWTLCGDDTEGWIWQEWTWAEPVTDYGSVVRLLTADGEAYTVLRPAGSDVTGP